MLHDREDVEDVLLREGGLMPAVKVVLLQQDLEGPKRTQLMGTTFIATWQMSLEVCLWSHSQCISCTTTQGQRTERRAL